MRDRIKALQPEMRRLQHLFDLPKEVTEIINRKERPLPFIPKEGAHERRR